MLNQLTSLKNLLSVKKKKTHYFVFMIHLVQNSLRDLNLVILICVNLDMVLVILPILCVHEELKLKLQNISCCTVNFTVLKD